MPDALRGAGARLLGHAGAEGGDEVSEQIEALP